MDALSVVASTSSDHMKSFNFKLELVHTVAIVSAILGNSVKKLSLNQRLCILGLLCLPLF